MFFIDSVPGGDVGIAIILTTIIVKLLLLPLSVKAAKTQVVMRELEPKLKELKETHKDDRETQAKEMMALYKDAGLNPFASIILIFLQIPIIISLYLSVYSGGGVALPAINTAVLYSWVSEPAVITMMFLGLVDIAGRSLPLALLAGFSQFIQANLSLPKAESATQTLLQTLNLTSSAVCKRRCVMCFQSLFSLWHTLSLPLSRFTS